MFVSGDVFWSYFVLGAIKEKDTAPERLLGIRVGVLIPVSWFGGSALSYRN